MPPRLTNLALVAILLLGLGLRLYHFDSIAPTNSDEGSYLRHARFMVTLAKVQCGMDVPVVDEDKIGIWRHLRKEDWSAKPCWLHSALIAGSMAVFGVNDAAGAMVSIVFSLAAVVLCYLMAREVGGEGAGLAAAAFLAVSFYWMLYSRGMWAEVDAVFFALLSLYLLFVALRVARRAALLVFLSGMAAAASVLCHYRLLYVIVPLGLSLLLVTPPREWICRGLRLAAGFAGLLFGSALVLRLASAAVGADAPFTGLMGALLERYLPGPAGVEQKGVQFGNVLAVAYYFLRNHGWTLSGLTLLGALVALLNVAYERRYAALLCMGLFSLLVLCFQVWVVARAASLMIPVVGILAGVGLAAIWRVEGTVAPRWRWIPKTVTIVLVGGVMAENGVKDIRLAGNRMGHEKAARFLADQEFAAVYADPESAILYGWYAPDLPYRPIRQLYGTESCFGMSNAAVVFDGQKFHMYPASVGIVSELERIVAKEAELMAHIPNLTTAWPEFLFDGTQAHTLEGMLESVRRVNVADMTSIRIYKVNH